MLMFLCSAILGVIRLFRTVDAYREVCPWQRQLAIINRVRANHRVRTINDDKQRQAR